MLPILDLQSSDPTCIYSTLLYVKEQATRLNIKSPCVTFDQPLWYKALAIIDEKNLNIVCRLGGFHLLMSFLGSIGHLMAGSGVEELLQEIYTPNVIQHVLSGKAFAQALHGHLLLHTALLTLVTDNLLDDEIISQEDLEGIATVDWSIVKDGAPADTLIKLQTAVNTLIENCTNDETATYWILYLKYIDVVKHYVRAERTGSTYQVLRRC